MTNNQSDTPRTDAACDDRKEAFDQWYFTLNGVMPDLLKDDVVRAMWLGWSAGMQCGQSDALSAERAKNAAVRDEALEEAAKVCERVTSADGLLTGRTPTEFYVDDGTGCAGAIRAMKGTP